MTQPLHIEEQTFRDMSTVFFPKREHSKLARCGLDFIVQECSLGNHPHVDIPTLRNFIEFLIKSKGYN